MIDTLLLIAMLVCIKRSGIKTSTICNIIILGLILEQCYIYLPDVLMLLNSKISIRIIVRS